MVDNLLVMGKDFQVKQQRLYFELNWIPTFGKEVQIHLSTICADESGGYKGIVSYINQYHDYEEIKHYGVGNGIINNSESLNINLEKVSNDVTKISIVIHIQQTSKKRQKFSQTKKCFIRISDLENGEELGYYDIKKKYYRSNSGIYVLDLYRNDDEWRIKLIGEGNNVNSVQEMAKIYQK